MEKTTLSEKGQIVIPKAVRVAHGWEPGMEIMIEDLGEGVLLKPLRPYQATVIEREKAEVAHLVAMRFQANV